PIDLLFVKKIGAPEQPELALGAISETDEPIWQEDVVAWFNLTDKEREELARNVRNELKKQTQSWRKDHAQLDVKGKIVILVDDGLATGATIKSAIHLLKNKEPMKIIVAVPVGARSTVEEIA